jgi:hypothetical protein
MLSFGDDDVLALVFRFQRKDLNPHFLYPNPALILSTMVNRRSGRAPCALLFMIGCLCLAFRGSSALTTTSKKTTTSPFSRKDFLKSAFTAVAFASPVFSLSQEARAEEKLTISDAQLKDIVKSDVLDRQFLATGDLTRSIYTKTATFTDEIDTYELDKFIKGTRKLFVGEKSEVRLVGDVEVSPEKVEFRFDENLMFNIPFRPVVALSGKVVLKRDLESGLISSYQEFWDQDVLTVLKTARF